jgi:NitT/TauT family transport system permease protein
MITRLRRAAVVLLQWVVAAVIVAAAWQLFIAPRLPSGFTASASEVGRQLQTWFAHGQAWDMTKQTMGESLVGLVAGSAVGVVLALLLGLSAPVVGRFFEPFLGALYAMPKFVLVPILFVWIGAGFTPRVVIIAVGTVPILTIYTMTGIRTVDPARVRMMRMFGAGRTQVARKLLIPHTSTHVITGLTLALPHAVFLAIGTEILFGDTNGIGGVLNTEAQLFNPAAVFGAVAIATVLSALLLALLQLFSRRLLGADVPRSGSPA